MFKVGLSSCGKALDESLFAAYARQGIDAIEISPNWPDYKTLDYGKIKALADQYGITLWSYHLPFQVPDVSTADSAWRLCSVEYLCETIKQASNIGIHHFVLHAGMELGKDDDKAARIACAKDSVNKLADFAARYNSYICIEDLPRNNIGNCSDEIVELLSVNDNLRVCFDTNHLLNEDYVHFIKRVGNKIATLHVSDYDFVDERHWLPGEGKVDWNKLIGALQEAGYSGVWMYEIGGHPDDTDYVQNARALFANYAAKG